MAKRYTLDNKLLVEMPAIQVREKIYAVDCRKKTVEKALKLAQNTDGEGTKNLDELVLLALGKENEKELELDNMPYPAYTALVSLVLAAMTGEDQEAVEARFQAERAEQLKR